MAYDVSERRAWQATGFGRSSQRYRKRSDPQVALRMRLKELAAARVRYGYRRLHILLRREGWAVAGFHSKMLHLPHASAVLACAGPLFLLGYVKLMMTVEAQSFEGLIDAAPRIVSKAYAELRSDIDWRSPFYIGLGGYSGERNRFESYYMRSVGQEETGPGSLPGAAWELMPAPELFAVPWPDENACARVNLSTAQPEPPFILDAETVVTKAVAASRFVRSEGHYGEAPGCSLVGSFIELASTLRERTQQQIMHRWPDRVNDLIDPTNGEPLPASIMERPIFRPLPADAQA
ncbi:hypothetical protein FHR71_003934 [Methylobacterium sp. RAS18]|nr:hypothetical protein [Methylobacterium sp. RAS18]